MSSAVTVFRLVCSVYVEQGKRAVVSEYEELLVHGADSKTIFIF